MSKPQNINENDITREDQNYLNEFSRLNMKFHRFEDEIKKNKATSEALKESLSSLDEIFEDNVKIMIGECFVEQSVDEAKGFIETRKVSYEKELKNLVDKIEQTKKRMNELKIILYAKFGKNINLEESEE